MTFQLDTTGYVEAAPDLGRFGNIIWSDLTPFTQGYIEALFDSICPEEDDSREMRTPRFDDLAPETLARIIADCAIAQKYGQPESYSGSGGEFWEDRQAGRVIAFPPLTVQLCDDGKVRFAS